MICNYLCCGHSAARPYAGQLFCGPGRPDRSSASAYAWVNDHSFRSTLRESHAVAAAPVRQAIAEVAKPATHALSRLVPPKPSMAAPNRTVAANPPPKPIQDKLRFNRAAVYFLGGHQPQLRRLLAVVRRSVGWAVQLDTILHLAGTRFHFLDQRAQLSPNFRITCASFEVAQTLSFSAKLAGGFHITPRLLGRGSADGPVYVEQ